MHQLRRADPSKLKHEEKLAFWINVHNALVMHVKFSSSLFFSIWVLAFVLSTLLSQNIKLKTTVPCYVLQSFLAHGIPRNKLKRMSLLLKVFNFQPDNVILHDMQKGY